MRKLLLTGKFWSDEEEYDEEVTLCSSFSSSDTTTFAF